MKQIKLKRLEIQNFRSQNISADFGTITSISGRNGVGKSTIMKAWMWLWSSYTDAFSVKNNALFDEKKELSPDTPKASVKAIIEIDGAEYTIERVAEAKFSRKRGTDEYVKNDSDSYTLYLDNVEIRNVDFVAWVESHICQNNMLPYLLDGSFFATLIEKDKDKARNILENTIGEVKKEDMRGDYSIISEELQRYSVEQLEERTKNEIKPIKKRIEEIPSIIDNKNQTIASLSYLDFDALCATIEEKKKEIEDIDNRILGNGEAIKPILGQRDHIFDIINQKTLEINNKRNRYKEEYLVQRRAILSKINEVESINEENRRRDVARVRDITSLEQQVEKKNSILNTLETQIAELRKTKEEIKSREFTDNKCAYCGQELPEEMLEVAKEKFNNKKKNELASIIVKGQDKAWEIANIKSSISELQSKIEELKNVEPFIPKSCDELNGELREFDNSFVQFESTEEYKALTGEIESLKSSLPTIPQNDNEVLTSRKRELQSDLEKLNRDYGIKFRIEDMQNDVKSLQEEAKSLGVKLALLEGKLSKCEEYKQEKSDIISFRVNGRLDGCHIDMWSTQKDGTVVPDIVLKGRDGVRYGALNFSDRIKTCVEIQKLFLRANDVMLPIWVDECSCFSSDNMPTNFDGQIIYIFANDNEQLTIE